MKNSENILITGSFGFVGSHLVKKLKTLPYKITEADIINGIDISLKGSLDKFKGISIVIHLAAKTFVPDSYKDPYEFYFHNIITTLNVLEFCRKNNAKLIYPSSYVYGKPKYLPIDEKHPVSAFNPYSQSKIICELLCKNYFEYFGVNSIIFRPFNIYGTGQDKRFLFPSIIDQMKRGKIILKDPRPKRDFIHIDDIVNAYIKAISYKCKGVEIFNLASGKSYSVKALINIIKNNFKEKITVHFTNEKRRNEILDTVGDSSKVMKQMKWKPVITFEEGIKSLLNEI